MSESESDSGSGRDATTLSILGTFFVVLGSLVLVGTAWTWGNKAATVVNIASGAVLAGIGGGMLLIARRLTSGAPSGGQGQALEQDSPSET